MDVVTESTNHKPEERLEKYVNECVNGYKPPASIQKKKVNKGKGTFVENALYESDAFMALRGVAPQMLINILGKREFTKSKNGKFCLNNKKIKLSYIESRKLGITQPRATRGFDELLAKGFIEIEHHGGGYQKDQSVYLLSDKWMFWKKGIVFYKRKKSVRRGFQGGQQRSNQHTDA